MSSGLGAELCQYQAWWGELRLHSLVGASVWHETWLDTVHARAQMSLPSPEGVECDMRSLGPCSCRPCYLHA